MGHPDQSAIDVFEAEFEERAVVDFKQLIRDVNAEVGIDAN